MAIKTFARFSVRFERHNKGKIGNVNETAFEAHNTQRTQPASDPDLPTLRRMCYFNTAGLTARSLF